MFDLGQERVPGTYSQFQVNIVFLCVIELVPSNLYLLIINILL